MARELCFVIKDDITSWTSGVGGGADDRSVKSTSVSHASGMFFSSRPVLGTFHDAGVSPSASKALDYDHQTGDTLRLSMRDTLCVTLVRSERSSP